LPEAKNEGEDYDYSSSEEESDEEMEGSQENSD
jgi:hypothetical protein